VLGEQTFKKLEVVVQKEGESRFIGFLGFELGLLLAFPFIRGIDSELNDKLGLEAVRSNVTHER
jgi:hypothetical protein